MPKVLWLLEHVCLRVDPLKDAAGSPFGKANRLYLYLHVQRLCVEWGSTNTNWHIGVHYVRIFMHTQNVNLKQWDMAMGHYGLYPFRSSHDHRFSVPLNS